MAAPTGDPPAKPTNHSRSAMSPRAALTYGAKVANWQLNHLDRFDYIRRDIEARSAQQKLDALTSLSRKEREARLDQSPTKGAA